MLDVVKKGRRKEEEVGGARNVARDLANCLQGTLASNLVVLGIEKKSHWSRTSDDMSQLRPPKEARVHLIYLPRELTTKSCSARGLLFAGERCSFPLHLTLLLVLLCLFFSFPFFSLLCSKVSHDGVTAVQRELALMRPILLQGQLRWPSRSVSRYECEILLLCKQVVTFL